MATRIASKICWYHKRLLAHIRPCGIGIYATFILLNAMN